MSTNQESNTPAAAADNIPQPAPTLTPEAVVEQLRAMRAQIGEVTPLTPEQRKTLRSRARTSNTVLQASINVIGALDNVSQAIGQPAGDVRQMYAEENEDESEDRELLHAETGGRLQSMLQRFSSVEELVPWLRPGQSYSDLRRTAARLRAGAIRVIDPRISPRMLADVIEKSIAQEL